METILEPAHALPVVMRPQVIVAGGGPAGFAAAIGAAREGAHTLVVERNSFLGGAATAGLMAMWGSGAEARGVAREIIDRLVQAGGTVRGRLTSFDPEMFKQVSLEMVEEADAKSLFYTTVSGPIVVDGRCTGIIIENKSGRQAILGDVVIDASGDADLAVQAGAPWARGREKDGKTRPLTLMFRMGNVDVRTMVSYAKAHPDQFTPDPAFHVMDIDQGIVRLSGFFGLVEEARKRGEVDSDCHYLRFEGVSVERGTMLVNTTRVYDKFGADGFELSQAEVEARKQMMKLVRFIVSSIPGCERAFLIDAASNIGIRETRRIEGEYIFDEEDVVKSRHFDDAIIQLRGRHNVGHEVHSPDRGEGSVKDIDHRQAMRQAVEFQIPYRSILPRNVEGLLVVGRGMSTSHSGDGYTRGQLTCMAIGYAAGIAAAIAAKAGIPPRAVDIGSLQSRLTELGVLPVAPFVNS